MRQTALSQSEAPGCVNSWADFSLQHTFIDNCHRLNLPQCLNLLDMSFSLLFHFLWVLNLESNFCFNYLMFCPVLLVSS